MARHPIMNRKAPSVLQIPDLMGGLNTRDSLSMINDNQLTDSLNMWWQDGVLKTRPGVHGKDIGQVNHMGVSGHRIPEMRTHNIYRDTSDGKRQLCSLKLNYLTTPTGEQFYNAETQLHFFWVGKETSEVLPVITGEEITSYFLCECKGTVYCFLSNRKIYKLNEKTWTIINEEEYTVPIIATYCKSDGDLSMSSDEVLESGVACDGYNLLSDYYMIKYNAFNGNATQITTVDNEPAHAMTYSLLKSTYESKYAGKKVKATYIKNGIKYIHEVTLTGAAEWIWEQNFNSGDGLKMGVCGHRLWFRHMDNGVEKTAYVKADGNSENNLEIKAPYISDTKDEALDKVFKMNRCEWFGGGAEGISGGTRLFLCDNSVDKEKALVIWSGLNDPLYFSENAYFYVGDTSSKVTGFGKQADILIVFKPNETWYTQYTRNTDITAENLINQSIVDYSASAVYFPLVQINPNIGCPYPDTVQLCRNRLVWLSNNGEVYSLVSNNQYNERNIYPVSEMVKRKIKAENAYGASSCDWNGYYCLNFGGRLYLMDYNSYGYQYISSYSKNEDANLRIPWYYWELPIDSSVTTESTLLNLFNDFGFAVFEDYAATGTIKGYILDFDLMEDILEEENKRCISSSFTTKLFDFSLPAYKKNVQLVNISLGNNGGEPIRVEFITEHGTEEQEIVLEGDETENRTAGYITNKALHPCIKGVARFGVRISCDGQMAADGMSLNYIVLGGIR